MGMKKVKLNPVPLDIESLSSGDLLTPKDVCQILNVDDSTVRKWSKNKAITYIELPSVGRTLKRIRIRWRSIKRILNIK